MAYFDALRQVQVSSDGGVKGNGDKVIGTSDTLQFAHNIEAGRIPEYKDDFSTQKFRVLDVEENWDYHVNNASVFQNWGNYDSSLFLENNNNHVKVLQNPDWNDVASEDNNGDIYTERQMSKVAAEIFGEYY